MKSFLICGNCETISSKNDGLVLARLARRGGEFRRNGRVGERLGGGENLVLRGGEYLGRGRLSGLFDFLSFSLSLGLERGSRFLLSESVLDREDLESLLLSLDFESFFVGEFSESFGSFLIGLGTWLTASSSPSAQTSTTSNVWPAKF